MQYVCLDAVGYILYQNLYDFELGVLIVSMWVGI